MVFKAQIINLSLLPQLPMLTSFQLHQSFCSLIIPSSLSTPRPRPCPESCTLYGPIQPSFIYVLPYRARSTRQGTCPPRPSTSLLDHPMRSYLGFLGQQKVLTKQPQVCPQSLQGPFPYVHPPEGATPTGMYISRLCVTQHVMEYSDTESNY